MPSIDKLTRRQLSIGMADWFRPYAESIAPFNQIEVDAGVFFNKGTQAPHLKTTAQASTPPFGLVGPGTYRYDLVYLDELGVPRSFPGTAQALPIVPWTGAPGQPGYAGAPIPANAFPIAYVLVDEVGAIIVIEADITDIRANFAQTQMAIAGDLAKDGVAAVGANLKRLGASHVHPLNTDLVLPTQTSKYGPSVPGASGVYADRAHQHQEDAVLAGEVDALIAGSVTYMERSETLEFTVDDANPTQACRLHQFQGRMIDAATLLPAALWANIQPAAPLTMTVGLGMGPGRGDSLNPAPGVDLVYYVYLIYKTVGAVWSLVYSQRPPTVGPDLSNPVLFGGYTHFRFVGTFFNAAAGWIIVAFRKHNNHVEYELGQLVTQPVWPAPAFDTTGDLSLSERVPPTSMRAFMCAQAEGRSSAQELHLRPPSLAGGSGVMPIHDTPLTYRNTEGKVSAYSDEIGAALHIDRVTGWVDLDTGQNIGYRGKMAGGGVDKALTIIVLGYEEFTDVEGSAHSW